MNELMQRRRALLAQGKSDLPFEWDYTEGINKVVLFGNGVAEMQNDGVYLAGNTAINWSAGKLRPNIEKVSRSFRTTIVYKDLVSVSSNSSVAFAVFNDEYSAIKIYRQKETISPQSSNVTRIYNGTVTVLVPWNLTDSGAITIEYDATIHTVTFKQGANSYTLNNPVPAEADIGLVDAQQGSAASYYASVKIQHIKIERI